MLERREDTRWPKRPRQQRRLYRMPLAASVGTLAEAFRDGGHATAAFVNQPILAPRRGFDRGFDHWIQAVGTRRVQRREQLALGNRQTWGSAEHAYENDSLLIDEFAGWMASLPAERPVFVWLHLLTPHRPHLPPDGSTSLETSVRERYEAEVRGVDALVGRALRVIAEGRGDASVVAFASDHGEAFGEHGVFEHGNTLHGEVMRVPLVLAATGMLPGGEEVDAVVSLLDVAPTLLDLAGLRSPPSMRGASLLPLVRGEGSHRPVLAEGMLYGATERVWIEDGWKLLVDQEKRAPVLYSLGDDPQELRDRFEEEPERAAALRARLDERVSTPPASIVPTSDAEPDADPGEDQETRDALRALGYVEDDES
jgi:arylsulfatase A-like enzyme